MTLTIYKANEQIKPVYVSRTAQDTLHPWGFRNRMVKESGAGFLISDSNRMTHNAALVSRKRTCDWVAFMMSPEDNLSYGEFLEYAE